MTRGGDQIAARQERADGGRTDHWIGSAIKHPGRMKHLAERHGVSTHTEMVRDEDKPGSLGRAARLGLRLSKMNKG